MGDEVKVEEQRTQTEPEAQPSGSQTNPSEGGKKSELSPEQKVIVGLRAEVKRLQQKIAEAEEESDPSDSDSTPADSGRKPAWADDPEKQVAQMQRRIKELESENRKSLLDKEKSEASREHGVPLEILADAKTSHEVWKRVGQWYKDVKEGEPEEKKSEAPPPSQYERSSGGFGGGNPSTEQIRAMSPEEFERFKQTLRRKR